jgi:outer membrane biosynthesis protein TonB
MPRTAAIVCVVALLSFLAFSPEAARAGDLQYNGRKLRRHVEPTLPEIARTMHLAGTVRLEVVVSPAGKVTSLKTLGGPPILITAAENAVKEWLFETDPHSTTVIVSFTFK